MAIEFPTTTMTLIERMGADNKEGWTEFWRRYETAVKSCIRFHIDKWLYGSKKGASRTAIPQDEVEQYIEGVFTRIRKDFKTYKPEGKYKFRTCLQVWIQQDVERQFQVRVISHCKKEDIPFYLNKESIDAELNSEGESGVERLPIDIIPDDNVQAQFEVEDELAYRMSLVWNAIKDACTRQPWSPIRRKILAGILAQKSNKEIAQELDVDSQNVSNVKARLREIAKTYMKQYEDDGVWFGSERRMYALTEESFMEALKWQSKRWCDG